MASAPRLLAQAVDMGVATVEDAYAGAVVVRPQPRSNAVHRVECKGEPVAYVKQAGTASLLDGDDTVAVEEAVLAGLGGWEVTPPLAGRGQPGTVWTRPVGGVELAHLTVELAHASGVAFSLGRTIRRWHDAPVRIFPRVAPEPWPLRADLLPSMETVPRTDELEQVLDAAYAPEIRRATRRAREDWAQSRVPIHGDLSVHNILVELGTPPAVVFVDVEACGLGAAEWDLACLEAALADLSGPTPDLPHAPELREAYAGSPSRGRPEWACVRALVSAWQVAAHPEQPVRALASTYLTRASRAAHEGEP